MAPSYTSRLQDMLYPDINDSVTAPRYTFLSKVGGKAIRHRAFVSVKEIQKKKKKKNTHT